MPALWIGEKSFKQSGALNYCDKQLHDVTYLLGHLADHCEADGCDDGLIDDLTAAKKFKEKLAQDDYNHVQ